MTYIKRIISLFLLFSLANFPILYGEPALIPIPFTGTVSLALFAFFIYFNICPKRAKSATKRLRALIGGYELLLDSFILILLETVFYIFLFHSAYFRSLYDVSISIPIFVNTISFILFTVVLLINGFFRVIITSKHLRVVWRVLLLLLWWMPILNIIIFVHTLKAVRAEYRFEMGHIATEQVHIQNQDCATKYPLVFVHGIFFRDWQLVNYWGRIPAALEQCGAKIYYGKQASSLPVAQSAAELKENILKILEETGAEKVNIIAHSKGGLDSRYMISKLGMADHVASLTTMNTPHRGCIFAGHVLKTLPKKVLGQMESKYNKIFHKLGDTTPDFRGGVDDLTADACRKFNEEVLDCPDILYQSVMSTMKSAGSASFPLNFTWRLVKKHDKEANDGLVSRSSSVWGNFLGEITVPKKRGVSHGDIVDLMREDIPGFDVRDYYINLVRELSIKGY